MQFNLEPSSLLNSTTTVLVLVLAVTTFLIVRMAERYKSSEERLSNEDIPDKVRRAWWFGLSRYAEVAIYLAVIAYAFYVAVSAINLITGIVHYYEVASPTPISNLVDLTNDYYARMALADRFSRIFLNDVIILFGVVFILAILQVLPSLSFLPINVVSFYWRTSKGSRINLNSAEKMVVKAKKSLEGGDYLSAVLLGGTALEFYMRNILDMHPPVTWSETLRLLENKLAVEERSKAEIADFMGILRETRKMRNSAAHPTADTKFTRTEAEKFIDNVEWLINELR